MTVRDASVLTPRAARTITPHARNAAARERYSCTAGRTSQSLGRALGAPVSTLSHVCQCLCSAVVDYGWERWWMEVLTPRSACSLSCIPHLCLPLHGERRRGIGSAIGLRRPPISLANLTNIVATRHAIARQGVGAQRPRAARRPRGRRGGARARARGGRC